ncbi:hypothetical protein [Nocardioides sp. GY 10127]|uniref:AAA family ATPase n=1 Tax=Nocardioides sp. GY 10127 TaxID=2569762 RepID=UPI0010A8C84B|nr:hypothetical protein [Nocardioides sp. GY 10127]TIC81648.1 hypothetical protein E8D37_10625 [Nocardioides sp. GY 10127]
MSPRVVLVAAAGAAWEDRLLADLDERPDLVVLKRCMDVEDLLASAVSGQADAAVLPLDAHGLDAAAVAVLVRHGLRVVAVVPSTLAPDVARLRAARVGLRALVPEQALEGVPDALAADALVSDALVEDEPPGRANGPAAGGVPDAGGWDGWGADGTGATPAGARGRVVAVWGPAGAPGRSTVAATLAGVVAARGSRTLLVDADPWGGSLAQQLGVLDEVSGLLAVTRLAAGGTLQRRWPSAARDLGGGLSVLTGLPRPDRWAEVRPGVLEELLDAAAGAGDVVVDTGFSLEDDPGAELAGRGGRNGTTLAALESADEVVVVGTTDPVGLARLARGLVDLAELLPGVRPHVALNRARPSLGWSREELADVVGGFGRHASLHLLPADVEAVDRAAVAGRGLAEQPECAFTRAVTVLADDVLPAGSPTAPVPGAGPRVLPGVLRRGRPRAAAGRRRAR